MNFSFSFCNEYELHFIKAKILNYLRHVHALPTCPLIPNTDPPTLTYTYTHTHWRRELSLSLVLKNMVMLSEGCWPTLRNFNGLQEKKWNHGRHARDQMLICSITWCLCNYSISNLLYDITVPKSIHKMIKGDKLLWLSWKAVGWMKNSEYILDVTELSHLILLQK